MPEPPQHLSFRSKESQESEISILNSLQLVGTIFAALLGLAFGSFLNVFLARFPEDESIVAPRSHCRHCEHTLAWWENIPLLSWIMLRGRCHSCRAWIGVRYPIVELAIGLLWTLCWLRFSRPLFRGNYSDSFWGCWGEHVEPHNGFVYFTTAILGYALLCWLLVALASLDQEYFWLPDILTLPGIGLGIGFSLLRAWAGRTGLMPADLTGAAVRIGLAILAPAGLILAIRLAYWIVRRQEGIGLGDAKLMAMLGAWLGLRGSMEAFLLAVLAACAVATVWLVVLAFRRDTGEWAKMPLPLGTFLSIAGLVEIFYPAWLLNPARFIY